MFSPAETGQASDHGHNTTYKYAGAIFAAKQIKLANGSKRRTPGNGCCRRFAFSECIGYFARTLDALGPLGESINSNSTVWPSSRFLKPLPPIDE